MFHELISMLNPRLARRRSRSDEREPPVPPGEPTVLNQERTEQRTEASRRRARAVR